MKKYEITITDASGSGAIKVSAANKTEARAEAKLYIKQWQLEKAKIGQIIEIEGGIEMLNLDKVYTHRSSANRDIRNAVKRGECEAGAYKTIVVDGGFQIQAQEAEPTMFAEIEIPATPAESEYAAEPVPAQQPGHEEWSEPATPENAPEAPGEPSDDVEKYLPKPEPKSPSAMSDTQIAILDALVTSEAVAGTWVVMASVTGESLPKKSLPGATRGLLSKGYIRTEWGKDDSGKRAAIATVTEAGYAALKAS